MIEPKQIHYHLIGGFGDVSTTRKLPQLYSPELSSTVILSSLVDIYPSERLSSRENISNLIDEIKTKRLKGQFDPNVATMLTNDLCEGKVRYFPFRDTEEFYQSFFDYVHSYDNSALDISTPNKTHLKFLEESIKRSQTHVLVEKPIVLNNDHLKKLSTVLAKHSRNLEGRVLMDAEHYSYYGNVEHYLRNIQGYMNGEIVKKDGSNFPLGEIKKILFYLEESEGFTSERNRELIRSEIPGEGIFLDLGPHGFSFFKGLGASVIPGSAEGIMEKANCPEIRGDAYKETSAKTSFKVTGENFCEEVPVIMRLGKAKERKKKNFYVEHQNGLVDLNVLEKRFTIYDSLGNELSREFYRNDAFQNVMSSFRDCIIDRSKKPFTPIKQAVDYMQDLFNVRESLVYSP